MEMFNVHQDAKLLPLKVQSQDYTFENDKLPAISSSASVDANGVTHISIVNIDSKKTHDVTIGLSGRKYKSVTGKILTSSSLQDHNTFATPDKIKPSAFKDAQLKDSGLSLRVPPFSVVVLELK
jgi:alpha-L-arabinofuranosidase